MKVTLPGEPAQKSVEKSSERARRLIVTVGGGFLLVMLMFTAWERLQIQKSIDDTVRQWGGMFEDDTKTTGEKWKMFLSGIVRGEPVRDYAIPHLVIDVPFKNMRKIYAKREEALRRDQLVQGPDDFVNGEIRFEDRVIPIKLRLKGDHTDHLVGKKWSFRIRVRGDDQLLGMRRFSIQHPNTRAYQAEALFFELARESGVMAPRYSFVNVTINGESIGIMALEEFFSKELVEFNRRREGVIIRFDESDLWAARDSFLDYVEGWEGAFDYYGNARVDSIASSQVAASEVLSKQFAVAQGLLKGFAAGKLDASEVFDDEQLGSLIAVADVFGAWHPLRWHNMRFYFNPISLKLEPIAYDGSLQNRYRDAAESVINRDPMTVRMLEDPAIQAAYSERLATLAGGLQDGSIQQHLRDEEARILDAIRPEFRMLQEFRMAYMNDRAQALSAAAGKIDDKLFVHLEVEKGYYPTLVRSELHQGDNGDVVQLSSAIPMDVVVVALDWVNEVSGDRIAANNELPLEIPARGIRSLATEYQLPVTGAPAETGWVLEVQSRLAGRTWLRTERPVPQQGALQVSPLPAAGVEEMQSRFPFLEVDTDNGQVRIRAGIWSFDQSLVIPDGYTLTVDAGAELRFATDAALIVHGPVQMNGTEESPVQLKPSDGQSWLGMVVMNADEESLLDYVRLGKTRSVVMDGWTLTGGLNFYQSDVRIQNSVLYDSLGEDALNIILSEFTLLNTEIRGTVSDAFDSDFSMGAVSGGSFTDIGSAGGGDGIDVSGSEVLVTDVVFQRVSDKALSVGEASKMDVSSVTISNTGTGAAAKDGSVLTLDNVQIDKASFAGITAYIKKQEYGAAEISATGITMLQVDTPVLAQNGNRISVDGVLAETQDVDVDALYETVMRPGLRK